ncbi:MAG: DUF1810 domain-containing protein [Pseudomonadota bacterium]|nr:DUF1810 domain-containing protein [Pseudomonadota bacterium]
MNDPYHLERFVAAQAPVYPSVVEELRAGRKRTHWMWFIFPQIAGLGRSETARYFAIASTAEALAYLAHSVLGPRLKTCTELALLVEGRSVDQVFGSPDDMKFRSSMTLFAHVAPGEPLFTAALRKYFAGEPDSLTLKLLG